MTPIETLKAAEKKARDAAETFTLEHTVKPNALMAGHSMVQQLVGAVQTLTMLGQGAAVAKILPECPKLGQRLLCGLPVIIANRPDAIISAVLIGDLQMLKAPQHQAATPQ
jgi:hypothetical protein